MTLEKTLRDYIIKPVIGLALIGSMYGCEKSSDNYTEQKTPTENTQEVARGNFNSFDLIATIGRDSRREIIQIRTADIDGDGDQDVIVGYQYGGIDIFENQIPQKNK